MQRRLLHIILMLVAVVASVSAQRYEAWLDGNYNHRTIAAYSGGDISQSIDVSALSPGLHFYNIRTQDANGQWGAVGRYLFVVPGMAGSSNMARCEYWLDGGYRSRTLGAHTAGDISLSADVSKLSPGLHYYNIRTQDGHGVWSAVNRYLFVVPGMAGEQGAVRYESWLDGDYEGRTVRTYSGGDIMDSVSVATLTPGIHYYNIRACDKHGVWGAVNRYLFLATEVVRPARISYWIDNDTLMAAEKAISGASVELTVSLANQGAGQHTFNCQLQGTNGKWTPVYSYNFTIEQQQDTLTHEPTTAEYFFDHDPGYGKGIPLERISTDTLHFVLSIEGLKAGAHMLYVRSADDGGKWSGTVSRPLYVSPVRQEQFVAMEYFFDDADPGFGKATRLSDFTVGMDSLVSTLPTAGLQAGTHLLNVRGRRADGLWSSVTSRSFLIIAHEPAEPFVEYFFDRDPGYGKGTVVKEIEKGTNHLVIDLGELPTGAHVLYVRSRNEEAQWSVTVSRPFFVCRRAGLAAIEYYFDDRDPGQGKATSVPLPASAGDLITFEVQLSGLSQGEHTLSVRAKGTDGLWTPLATEAFTLTGDSGIGAIASGEVPTAIFTLGGYKTDTPRHGLNIVRYKDGRTQKKVNKK